MGVCNLPERKLSSTWRIAQKMPFSDSGRARCGFFNLQTNVIRSIHHSAAASELHTMIQRVIRGVDLMNRSPMWSSSSPRSSDTTAFAAAAKMNCRDGSH